MDRAARAPEVECFGSRTIDVKFVDRRVWWNWFLITGMTVVITLGLATATLPLLRGRLGSPWPWIHTDLALLAGLSLGVLILTVYLTQQQRRLASMRRELQHVQDQAIQRMRRDNDRLTALLRVSQTMGAATDPQVIFDAITKSCMDTFECEQVSLMIFDPLRGELEVRSAAGHVNGQAILGARQLLGEGIAGTAAKQGGSVLLGPNVAKVQSPDGVATPSAPLCSAMVVPIYVRGQLVGVLNAASRTPKRQFDTEDLRALEVFAENAGTCIRHAEQSAWVRRRMEGA